VIAKREGYIVTDMSGHSLSACISMAAPIISVTAILSWCRRSRTGCIISISAIILSPPSPARHRLQDRAALRQTPRPHRAALLRQHHRRRRHDDLVAGRIADRVFLLGLMIFQNYLGRHPPRAPHPVRASAPGSWCRTRLEPPGACAGFGQGARPGGTQARGQTGRPRTERPQPGHIVPPPAGWMPGLPPASLVTLTHIRAGTENGWPRFRRLA
jgi:hypothetical protein